MHGQLNNGMRTVVHLKLEQSPSAFNAAHVPSSDELVALVHENSVVDYLETGAVEAFFAKQI